MNIFCEVCFSFGVEGRPTIDKAWNTQCLLMMQKIVNCTLIYIDLRCYDFADDQSTKKIKEWTKGENTGVVLAKGLMMTKLEICDLSCLVLEWADLRCHLVLG